MSLYDSIISHERQGIEAMMDIMANENPNFREEIESQREDYIHFTIEKLKVILGFAQKYPNTALRGVLTERAASEIERMERAKTGREITDREIKKAKMGWVKAVFAYYQQLMRQEGKAADYEKAVRLQFPDRNSLARSLNAMLYAEKAIGAASKSRSKPTYNQGIDPQLRAAEYLYKLELNYFFPKE